MPESVRIALASATTDEERADLWRQQRHEQPNLFFHETYHFWQGARLPYLHWYAMLAYFDATRLFVQLALEGDPLKMDGIKVPAFDRLATRYYAWGNGNDSFFLSSDEPPDNAVDAMGLSEIDLLENACSLAEFQVSVPNPLDPRVFSRWSKRHPSYVEAIKYVGRFLRDEALAMRCFLSLVYAAFHTSQPVRAFHLLLRAFETLKDKPDMALLADSPEPGHWDGLFESLLDALDYEAEPDASIDLLDHRFFRLNLTTWVNGGFQAGGETMGHPLLSIIARAWLAEAEKDPDLARMLTFPAYVNQKTRAHVIRDFDPPITVTRFHGRPERIMIYGDPKSVALPREAVLDFITMYSVVRRATNAFNDPAHRTCWHNDCPHFANNYCNSYLVIPDHYSSCGFPKRVARLVETWRRKKGGK